MSKGQAGNYILVGNVGSGKSTLLKALLSLEKDVTKTQALVFHDNNIIDSPGEFLSNRTLYGALLNTITRVDIIVYLQAADSGRLHMPADLLRLYAGKRVVGVVSKTDVPGAKIEAAEALLAEEGIDGPYFRVSKFDQASIARLEDYLQELGRGTVDAVASSEPVPAQDYRRQV